MSPEEAVELIKDGDVVATGGFIGTGLPEIISSALEEKYKKSHRSCTRLRDLPYQLFTGGDSLL